jgi:hypothetical protein
MYYVLRNPDQFHVAIYNSSNHKKQLNKERLRIELR